MRPAKLPAKVTVAPKKAGTKTKPKNSSIHLNIVNNDPKKTLSKLTITQPSTFKLSAKGLTYCNQAALENAALNPSACPKASKIGKGVAAALLGVTSPTPSNLTFDVTAVAFSAKKLGFILAARELPVNVLSPATIGKNKLTIIVPDAAQQPTPGVYAGLKSIDTTLKASKGKHYLASTVGCKKKKHKFSTKLTFVNNGATPASETTVAASSKCS